MSEPLKDVVRKLADAYSVCAQPRCWVQGCENPCRHAEHFYRKVRYFCKEHTPWSGHREDCPKPCEELMAQKRERCGVCTFCKFIEETLRAARDQEGPPLVGVSNGEAGDDQSVCDFCDDETDEPHTWKQCAEILKVRRDVLAAYIDSGAHEGELVLQLSAALRPFVKRALEIESVNAFREPDDAQPEMGSLTMKDFRRALAASRTIQERATEEKE